MTLQEYNDSMKKMYKRFFGMLFTFDWFLIWIKFTTNPAGSNFFSRKGNRFSRGAAVTLTLTTRCTLECDYCPLLHERDKYPNDVWQTYGLEDWKKLVDEFPEWMSLVLISGGEPTLIKWLPEFVNWLLDSGRKVVVFTNLAVPSRFETIKKSTRLQIQATFHHYQDDAKRYTKAYNMVTGYGHKVDATELGNEEKILPFTHYKPFITTEIEKVYKRQFHCAPDAPKTRALYMGCEQFYQ